jgi:plasmid stabilization system protein ParE
VNYWIHPDAEGELEDAAVHYAENVSRTLAEAFLAEYERVLDLLVENQQRAPHGDFRMRVYHLNVFPYTVIYEEDPTAGPQIYAVAPQAREPGYWKSRL